MPSTSTITGYNVFSSGTLIRSAAVNTNFSVYRGHLIAVDPDTATLSDLTYDLGSTGYRWKRAHVQEYVFSHHSTPSAPIAGQVKVYFKSDGNPYYLNASGTEAGFGGFASPLTTKGDLHGYTSTGDARVPVGTNGHVLTADSSATAGVSWKPASVTLAITTVTGTYTATGNEDVILADSSNGAYTIYLATATGNSGKQCAIKKITSDLNAISLGGIGSETVDDTTVSSVNTLGETLWCFSNNANWMRLYRDIPSYWSESTISFTATTSAPTKGTNTTDKFRWRRVGGSIEALIDYVQTGAGSAGSGNYLISMPTGLTIATGTVLTNGATISVASMSMLLNGTLSEETNNITSFSTELQSGAYNANSLVSRYMANLSAADGREAGVWTSGISFGDFADAQMNFHLRGFIPIQGWKG